MNIYERTHMAAITAYWVDYDAANKTLAAAVAAYSKTADADVRAQLKHDADAAYAAAFAAANDAHAAAEADFAALVAATATATLAADAVYEATLAAAVVARDAAYEDALATARRVRASRDAAGIEVDRSFMTF